MKMLKISTKAITKHERTREINKSDFEKGLYKTE